MRKVALSMEAQAKYEIIKSLVDHHGNKGRKPVHAISQEKKAEIILLYNNKYWDATFFYACELLEEHDGIKISPSALTKFYMTNLSFHHDLPEKPRNT